MAITVNPYLNFAVNTRSSGRIWNRVMYAMKATGPSSAKGDARYTAHDSSPSIMPTYMGLRVYR